MTTHIDTERIVGILRSHRDTELSAEDVEVVADLQIIDLYAARVRTDATEGTHDYLVHPAAGRVESVSFDEWPPRRPGSPGVRS